MLPVKHIKALRTILRLGPPWGIFCPSCIGPSCKHIVLIKNWLNLHWYVTSQAYKSASHNAPIGATLGHILTELHLAILQTSWADKNWLNLHWYVTSQAYKSAPWGHLGAFCPSCIGPSCRHLGPMKSWPC